jgi:subtilisin family serine protease
MIKKILLPMLLLTTCFIFAEMYHPSTAIVKTVEKREILRGKFGLKAFDDYMERYEVDEVKSITKKTDNNYYLISAAQPIDFQELKTKKFDGIEFIQPNYMNRMFATPNDPLYYHQLMENINLPQAWNYTVGNDEIVIAIIDSGLHFEHPDLQKNIWFNKLEIPDNGEDNDGNGYIDDWRGWDFVDAPEWAAIAFGDFIEPDNEPFDDNNHGTHVAGIIGATANNNEGIAGVCWNVKMMILRSGFNTALGGYLQDDDAAAALFYAADMGADIISISWGDNNFSPIIADACQYAYNKGSIIVAAAGNDASAPIVYPARLSTTIAVGAVDANNRLASFSSYGPNMDLVAPGVGIMSTFDKNPTNYYQTQSGTSMSVPFVAGAIGLLLSTQPGLSFEEVKSRLSYSCRDLGSPGYDIEYGTGLLDIYRLLTVHNVPLVKIDSPFDFQAFSESFDIVGTVQVTEFKYYTVMYTTEIEPSEIDWKNVNDHKNTPFRYYQQIENGLLATFSVDELLQDMLDYQIRVRAYDQNHRMHEHKRTVKIDKTAPIFFHQLSGFEKRFAGENVVYYLQTVYNEPVFQRLEMSMGNLIYELHTSRSDSIHVVKLPESAPEGTYNVTCFAVNEAGLSVSGVIPFPVELQYYSIDTNQYEQINLPQFLFINRDFADFDGNGKYEFMAYEKINNTNVLSIFEVNGDSLIQKYTFPEFITPRAIGNTNNSGMEVLGVVGDIAKLYEAQTGASYPSQQVFSWSVTFGADFIDYDGDGISEVALVKNLSNISAKRVVQIFKRAGNTFNLLATLENASPGVPERNIFVPKVVAGNLNNNGIPDVITADQEGDVMIFENGQLAWMRRGPVQNTFFLGIGNFTGHTDARRDFCIGGYSYNPDNDAINVAYFEFFTYDINLSTYKKIGYVSFDDIAVRNSIAIADMNGDGTDEIIIDIPPNIYIIDYINMNGLNEFHPIWKGESGSELQNTITALPTTADQPAHIIANRTVNGELKSNLIRKRETIYPLSAPQLFQVQPVNESQIELSWQENHQAQTYKIYRKHNGLTELIAELSSVIYLDNNLTAGESYFYQISSCHTDEMPSESLPTIWKGAVPFFPPKIEKVQMISNFEIELICTQELKNDAILITNFSLNNGYGFPHSVNWKNNHYGVTLRFAELLQDPISNFELEDYQLSITRLFGHTGVAFQDAQYPDNIIPIAFRQDVDPPYIVKAETYGERSVMIFFNEPLQKESAENIDNFALIMPPADINNSIESIIYDSNGIEFTTKITLHNKPQLTNQEYFLKINRVQDLAGNVISNFGNKIVFSLNDIAKLNQHVVAPNPFKTKIVNETRFFLPVEQKGIITIYDLSGGLVFEDTIAPLSRLRNYYAWNGRNMTNQRVSSGLYLYVIKMGKEIVRGKIAVVN